MLRDIMRFNRKVEKVDLDDSTTIGELMDILKLGEWFRRFYLMPFCGAIWSTPPSEIRNFPAKTLIQFFRNHALLNIWGQHQWWTVDGGSVEYVRRLEAHFARARSGDPERNFGRSGQSHRTHEYDPLSGVPRISRSIR